MHQLPHKGQLQDTTLHRPVLEVSTGNKNPLWQGYGRFVGEQGGFKQDQII